MSSRGQQKRGGPPAWSLGEGLTTPHRKKKKLVTKGYTGTDCLERRRQRKMKHETLGVSIGQVQLEQ